MKKNRFSGHAFPGHSGGINGFSSNLRRYPKDSLTIVVLSNLEGAPSPEMTQDLAAAYLGLPAAPAFVAVTVKSEVLDRYVGDYELTKGFVITVKRDGATLTARATGQSAFPLTAVSDTEFHYQPADITLVFPVKGGPAPSLQLTQGGLAAHGDARTAQPSSRSLTARANSVVPSVPPISRVF